MDPLIKSELLGFRTRAKRAASMLSKSSSRPSERRISNEHVSGPVGARLRSGFYVRSWDLSAISDKFWTSPSVLSYKLLINLASPTGFEPVLPP